MGDVEVRLVGPGGLSAVDALVLAELVRELVAGGAALGWVEPPPVPEVVALFAEELTLAVAYVGLTPVGFGYWRRYARPTHRVNADIEKVAVSPKHQGRGVGRAMVSALIEAAREQGIEVLTLDVRGDNVRAAALYESLSFRRYGVLERFVAFGDDRYDKLLYALDLRAASKT
ncbi:ribosomal protein S18 acetylase RimI-like enzyme [Actinoplanes octamycinicus]|uniref:Ribosomal protein S18 acetylase RimI-like enzyme n=1 Tax=Actinoplanes octamycinicus TaxID=135948 RepID=A0A7W7GYR5_9ACTN|nr:GNAT family N-acetyltransferase [Actinoplanes octamycinicus]MBB4740825.1 ribosomal protein S18 acetylase RimI-like enzyme [Actinoplanes octamycinicus]GIE55728.1 GNAT family N-acetyltransferase [Actinoplanes octamycinicus]